MKKKLVRGCLNFFFFKKKKKSYWQFWTFVCTRFRKVKASDWVSDRSHPQPAIYLVKPINILEVFQPQYHMDEYEVSDILQ
jgi:hypothetical protein